MEVIRHRRVECGGVVSIRAVALHMLLNLQILASSVLNDPFIGRTPELWVRLVVSVPILGSSWRVKIILPFYRGNVAVCAEHVVGLCVGRRGFGCRGVYARGH